MMMLSNKENEKWYALYILYSKDSTDHIEIVEYESHDKNLEIVNVVSWPPIQESC